METNQLKYDTTSLALLKRIETFLAYPEQLYILDPACGNALAISDLQKEINKSENVKCYSYGIEKEDELASAARKNLSKLGKGTYEEARISHGSFSFMLIHPSIDSIEPNPLQLKSPPERTILVDTTPYLAPGGVMAYIIPKSLCSSTIRKMITYRFSHVRLYSFPDDERNPFDKIIILGVMKAKKFYDPETEELLGAILESEIPPLPYAPKRIYALPYTEKPKMFRPQILDPEDLEEESKSSAGWSKFKISMESKSKELDANPPIPLHQGHIALLLSSGNLDGRIGNHLVKGRVVKSKTTEHESVDGVKSKMTEKDRYSISVRVLDPIGNIKTLS